MMAGHSFAPARLAAPLTYRPGERNQCPGCHGVTWLVGRLFAECGRCAFPLPLATQAAPVGDRSTRHPAASRAVPLRQDK